MFFLKNLARKGLKASWETVSSWLPYKYQLIVANWCHMASRMLVKTYFPSNNNLVNHWRKRIQISLQWISSHLTKPRYWNRATCCNYYYYQPEERVISQQIWLTHLPLDKMAAILQTKFRDAFSWMKIDVFWLSFHWSLFLSVQLTIPEHWFR